MDEIDNCRPYFIGILGERYGWVQNKGEEVDEALKKSLELAVQKYGWVKNYTDRSIVELEILYGALHPELSKKYEKPKESEKEIQRSFIYFRDTLSITKKFQLGDTERQLYEETSEESYLKLRTLKQTLKSSGLPILDGYESIAQLVNAMVEDLTYVLDIDFPADEPQALIKTDLFSLQKTPVFIPNPPLFKLMNEFIDSAHSSVPFSDKSKKNSRAQAPVVKNLLFLHSAEGFGKSTLVQKFINSSQSDPSSNLLFVYHSVANNQPSTSPSWILSDIHSKLSDFFPLSSIPLLSDSSDDIRYSLLFPSQFLSLLESLSRKVLFPTNSNGFIGIPKGAIIIQ